MRVGIMSFDVNIPDEVAKIVLMLVILGVVIGIILFLAFQGGVFRLLNFDLGFFKGW